MEDVELLLEMGRTAFTGLRIAEAAIARTQEYVYKDYVKDNNINGGEAEYQRQPWPLRYLGIRLPNRWNYSHLLSLVTLPMINRDVYTVKQYVSCRENE